MIEDVKRIKRFNLIENNYDGKIREKFGVLLATCWNDNISSWWKNKLLGIPEGCRSPKYNKLRKELPPICLINSRLIREYEKKSKEKWRYKILYVIFEIM